MLEQNRNSQSQESQTPIFGRFFEAVLSGLMLPKVGREIASALLDFANFSTAQRQIAEGVKATEQIAQATAGAQGKSILDSGVPVYVTSIEQLGNGGPVEAFETARTTTPASVQLNSGKVLTSAAPQLAVAA